MKGKRICHHLRDEHLSIHVHTYGENRKRAILMLAIINRKWNKTLETLKMFTWLLFNGLLTEALYSWPAAKPWGCSTNRPYISAGVWGTGGPELNDGRSRPFSCFQQSGSPRVGPPDNYWGGGGRESSGSGGESGC